MAGLFLAIFLLLGCNYLVNTQVSEENNIEFMNKKEREALKEEARDMFYHAYNAYMANAYPADELMPLSCKGRYRGSESNRGDIDLTLGNFSLTLVDTLDTLVVLGDFEEFENAVKLVIRDVTFDTDVIVSLFETNIRMLGGLLSGHILAEYLQQRAEIMPWYRGELLNLAKDLGYRFLPAFNTTTGIPYGRINLKHGMKGVPLEVSRETCTACAGSMILEMAALSRLTGEFIFESKAQKAMDVLWRMRHRGTDLMGSVLNVHSGDWVRRDSGVGAGIDSYYEYCLKAYILLGDEKYLGRFNRHYQAVMKYVSQGPMLLDVHMHRPNTNAKNFMDALLAFWPGLQVLKGDIKPAVETHEMLYQVMQRHNFIPEAFTTDFQVHWGHHPLRPEFLESTYFLYRATGDHYYLGVGRKVLKSLQTYARVPCGYAAVSDVRTNKHDDTMDSFVLSETLKYLFLLFAEPSELVLDLDEFIFTTEGHLLPLTLASIRTNISTDYERDTVQVEEMDRTCPNSLHLFPASVRQPLRNLVEDVCPKRSLKRRVSASSFQANNIDHLKLLSDMGITILTLADGRVQFLHTFSNAKSTHDAEEGLLFMQEMIELSKFLSHQTDTKPLSVIFTKPGTEPPEEITLLAGPAQFGPDLRGTKKSVGKVIFANPRSACSDFLNDDQMKGKIVIVDRGSCMFVSKARRIQKAGAIAGIVLDDSPGSSAITSSMFAMSGDGKQNDDVKIPIVFLFSTEANQLVQAIHDNESLTVTIADFIKKDDVHLKAPMEQSIFERFKGSLSELLSQQLLSESQPTVNPVTESKLPQPEEKKEDEFFPLTNYLHLQALIKMNPPQNEVRIMTTLEPPNPVQKTVPVGNSLKEKQWRSLRQLLVDSLHSPNGHGYGFAIHLPVLKEYFKILMLDRGENIERINNSGMLLQIVWFLRELSELRPRAINTSDIIEFVPSDIFSQKLDNSKLEEPDKSEIKWKLKGDSGIDGEFSQEKEDSSKIRYLNLRQLEQLMILVLGSPSQADRNFKQHPLAEKVDSRDYKDKMSLLLKKFEGEMKIVEENKVDELKSKSSQVLISEETQEEKPPKYVHLMDYRHLQLFVKRELIKEVFAVKAATNIPVVTEKVVERTSFNEKQWYQLRQVLVNSLYAPDKKNPEISIDRSNLIKYFDILNLERGINIEKFSLVEKIRWFLEELSELKPVKIDAELTLDRVPSSFVILNSFPRNEQETVNVKDEVKKLLDTKSSLELDQKLEEHVFKEKQRLDEITFLLRNLKNVIQSTISIDEDKKKALLEALLLQKPILKAEQWNEKLDDFQQKKKNQKIIDEL